MAVPKTSQAPIIVAATWEHLDTLRPWGKNPRDNDQNSLHVADLIVRFGFVAPICVWTSKDMMVAGHTRLKAMKHLLSLPEAKDRTGFITAGPSFVPRGAPPGVTPGMVPVRFHEFRTPAEAKSYAVADNRSNELSAWRSGDLKDVFAEIRLEDPTLIDDGLTSFTASQVDQIDAGVLVEDLDMPAEKGDKSSGGGEKPETGEATAHFKCGQYKLFMTDATMALFEEKAAAWVKRTGSLYGFAKRMVEMMDPESDETPQVLRKPGRRSAMS